MGLVLANQTSGANFDLRILKGRGGKAKFFSCCNSFFIAFDVAYVTTLILPSGSSWRGQGANDGSFHVHCACLVTST
jgi:hypothetical protein